MLYGVKAIERLMRDIRPDDPRPVLETTRLKKAPNQKKRMKNLLTGMEQKAHVPPNQKKRMKKFLKGLKHIPPKRMGQRLHVMKRKIRSEQKKIERKKSYDKQLERERSRIRTPKRMKRFLKRLQKYNLMMNKVPKETKALELQLELVERLMIEQKQFLTIDIRDMTKIIRAGGRCAYCHKVFARLSREHLLPRSVGGRTIIRICFPCNFERGCRGDFGPFLSYIRKYPHRWTEAVNSTSDTSKTTLWLRRWRLDSNTSTCLRECLH
jgi:hypothetical protein